jgi:hypothetical protein
MNFRLLTILFCCHVFLASLGAAQEGVPGWILHQTVREITGELEKSGNALISEAKAAGSALLAQAGNFSDFV